MTSSGRLIHTGLSWILKRQVDESERMIDMRKQSLDRFDGAAVDSLNVQVNAHNAKLRRLREKQDKHNQLVGLHQQCVKDHNALGGLQRSIITVTGGVNLHAEVQEKPMLGIGEAEIMQPFQEIASKICNHEEPLINPSGNTATSLVDAIRSQKDVVLNVLRVALGEAIPRKQVRRVILHSLKQKSDLNNMVGELLEPMEKERDRYRIRMEGTLLDVKRCNFMVEKTNVKLIDLKNARLNGQVAQIKGAQSALALRYIVRLQSGEEVAVQPKNVLLPTGTSVVLHDLVQERDYNGREGILVAHCPMTQSERSCEVRLSDGKILRVKLCKILAWRNGIGAKLKLIQALICWCTCKLLVH